MLDWLLIVGILVFVVGRLLNIEPFWIIIGVLLAVASTLSIVSNFQQRRRDNHIQVEPVPGASGQEADEHPSEDQIESRLGGARSQGPGGSD